MALAAAAALFSAGRALGEAGENLSGAWERRHLDYRLAADYLYGREFLDSVRAIRRRVPEDGTIWFVDAEPEPAAAPYWALHYLAPRKLVKLGTTRHRSLGWLARKAPDGVDEILIVGADREPLRMVRVDSIEGVGRKRAR